MARRLKRGRSQKGKRRNYVMVFADDPTRARSGFGGRKQIAAIAAVVSMPGIGQGRKTCLAELSTRAGVPDKVTNICFVKGRQVSGTRISFDGPRAGY